MALYESVIIGRQDLTPSQFETIVNEFISVIESLKGTIQKQESWGLRNLAYKINKNRKGHYMLLNIDGPADAIVEYAPAIHVAIEILKKLACKGYNKQQLQESKKEMIRLWFDAAPGSSAEDLFASVETR